MRGGANGFGAINSCDHALLFLSSLSQVFPFDKVSLPLVDLGALAVDLGQCHFREIPPLEILGCDILGRRRTF